jgi:hypothetical protein
MGSIGEAMSRITLLCCLVWAFSLSAMAQNIVPNYSFETNPGCPTGPCEWQRATSWNNVNMLTGCGSYGTPDYYHTCGAGFSHLPNNGYLTVNPHTGNAVIGFLTWSGGLSPNFRELVSTQLTSPMIVGQNYSVSFWICNGFTPYYGGGSNHIGLDFSTAPLVQGGGISNVVSLVPEYEIPGVFFSNGWVNYTFNIVPTVPYQYITFGNFYNDAATTATLFYAAAPYFRCYYFIDDVVIQTAVPLPVKLDRPVVNATVTGSRVAWEAQAQEGIVDYAVERCALADGNFERVGLVAAHDAAAYTLADDAIPSPGTWYYRVRALDADGASVTSETVAFVASDGGRGVLSVSPSGNGHVAAVWMAQAGGAELSVLDVQGRELWGARMEAAQGMNRWEMPTAGLSAGVYLVRVRSAAGILSRRIVIAH